MILIFFIVFSLFSCEQQSDKSTSYNLTETNEKGVSDNRFIEEIDSLFDNCFNLANITMFHKLDSICSRVDGYASEYFMVRMDQYFVNYTKYTISNLHLISPSCLENRLIDEWSINGSTPKQKKVEIQLKLKRDGITISKEETEFIKKITERINADKWN